MNMKKSPSSESSSDTLSSDCDLSPVSKSWLKTCRRTADEPANNGKSDDSDIDSDDADDEDWVALEYDKKRSFSSRPPLQLSGNSNKFPTSSRKEGSRIRVPKSRATVNRPKTTHHYDNSYYERHRRHQHRFGASAEPTGRRVVQETRTRASSRIRNPMSPSSSLEPRLLSGVAEPRQCLGPGCTKEVTREDTKYCSETCGLRLAFNRLQTLFTEQLSWNAPSDIPMAERMDRHHLESIQQERCSLRDRLIQLEMDHQQLTELISQIHEVQAERVKSGQPLKSVRSGSCSQQTEQVEQPITCVTCGSEVSTRHALRHMEKCFQKMEGNTVFCANQKEQSMGTPLFCDAYDVQAKAYCKRLRVVCEHYREPELPSDTLCGFPLVRDVFEGTGEYCQVLRKKCSKHFGWERLRRAHIDLERYRHLIRLDELLQEEQRIRQSMSQRGGILGLLLHRTIDHNPSVQIPSPPELIATTTIGSAGVDRSKDEQM